MAGIPYKDIGSLWNFQHERIQGIPRSPFLGYFAQSHKATKEFLQIFADILFIPELLGSV
jgi:hypothetical protein